MILSEKVSDGEPGATSGSRLKIMCSLPGSVAIIGLTGEVKCITNVGGFRLAICAVKCTATLPIKIRREA
jgi:hypothetical protein